MQVRLTSTTTTTWHPPVPPTDPCLHEYVQTKKIPRYAGGFFFCLLVCLADVRDDVNDLIIAAAAAGGALGGVLHVFKKGKQGIHSFAVPDFVQNVKIGDVVAVTHRIVLLARRDLRHAPWLRV